MRRRIREMVGSQKITIVLLLMIFLSAGCQNSVIGQTRTNLDNLGLAELAVLAREKIHPGSDKFLFGTTITPFMMDPKWNGQLKKDPKLFETTNHLVKKNFNYLSLGIYMQTTQTEGEDKFSWQYVDDWLELVKSNNMRLTLHPLFGHNTYNPRWLNKEIKEGISNERLKSIIDTRAAAFAEKFSPHLSHIDVFNESLRVAYEFDGGSVWKKGGAKGWPNADNIWVQLGWHKNGYPLFLTEMFTSARKHFGDKVHLIWNEPFNDMPSLPLADVHYAKIKKMLEDNVPIDGVGMQCHFNIKNKKLMCGALGWLDKCTMDVDAFTENAKRFGELGLDVHVTEFDIHILDHNNDNYAPPSEQLYDLQAKGYADFLEACIKSKHVKSFKMWGFIDWPCWNPHVYTKREKEGFRPYPGLWHENGEPKKAYFAIRKMLIRLITDQSPEK